MAFVSAQRAPVLTQLLIGNTLVPASGGRRFEIRNPADPREVVGYAAAANREDTARAIETASAAFPGWSRLSYRERAAYLEAITLNVTRDLEPRIELFVREHGKIRREASLEMTRLTDRFHYTAGLADELAAEREYPAPPVRSVITMQPLGVAALIVPWNWPLSILAAKLPQALMAGNTVVVKPSSHSPLATLQTLTLMAEVLPAGVLNVVTGPSAEVGAELLSHPKVRKVNFTGGIPSGKSVMRAASDTIKRVTLELGGNDPAIVLDDFEITDTLIDRMVAGAFISTGQVCMALKRLYVHRSKYRDLVDAIAARLERAVVGNGLDSESTMGPLNHREQLIWIRDLVQDAAHRGAVVHACGRARDDREFARGYFHLPTIVLEAPAEAAIVREEQFGPVLPVIPFDDEEDAIAAANDTNFGLCSSVWSPDVDRAVALARRIEAGYTYINNHGPLGQDNRVPFGGMKESGLGRQLGIEGVREFLEYHSISISM
jgi:acyl-CoA reductase-like NAD-dependent aldehyde dehydrogenase